MCDWAAHRLLFPCPRGRCIVVVPRGGSVTESSATEERDPLMKMTTDVQTGFQTIGRVFTRVCEDVHDVKERVTKVETRLDRVEGRLEKVETRLDKVDHRLGDVESGLANQTRRISDLERTTHNGFTEL